MLIVWIVKLSFCWTPSNCFFVVIKKYFDFCFPQFYFLFFRATLFYRNILRLLNKIRRILISSLKWDMYLIAELIVFYTQRIKQLGKANIYEMDTNSNLVRNWRKNDRITYINFVGVTLLVLPSLFLSPGVVFGLLLEIVKSTT